MNLYIIRGLPGSGKSTLAKELTPYVCEADQYFMKDGKYEFNPKYLSLAHAFCEAKCMEYMDEGAHDIAIANTFSRHWEFAKYENFAIEYGYRIVEITLTGKIYDNVLLPIIENAFREYARAHKGCTKQIEDKGWKDFLSKLQKHL